MVKQWVIKNTVFQLNTRKSYLLIDWPIILYLAKHTDTPLCVSSLSIICQIQTDWSVPLSHMAWYNGIDRLTSMHCFCISCIQTSMERTAHFVMHLPGCCLTWLSFSITDLPRDFINTAKEVIKKLCGFTASGCNVSYWPTGAQFLATFQVYVRWFCHGFVG